MALHGFSTHGTGGGSGPVVYFIAGEYYAESVDENGDEVAEWRPRDPLPEVIEGDPALMIAMIDAVTAKHKYTSGVLSFTAEDTLKLKALGIDEAIQDMTSRLKEMLFAGISEEHQHILIVAQTHLDRLELHYVTPRWNYEVDRAWNPAPPGSKKFEAMDALMDLINVKYGLDDPRDPLRARVTKVPQWIPQKTKPLRDQLNSFFKELVADGVVKNRSELIKFAKDAGFEITRTGSDYISVKAPGAEKAVRLEGEIYNERFTSSAELANTQAKSFERSAYLSKPAVAERYKNAVRERSAFVEKRFAKILKIVRSGKTHEETRSFYAKSRSRSIDLSKNNTGRVRANNNIKRGYKGTVNDRSGNEIDSLIATAERRIGNAEQSTVRATGSIRGASQLVQRASGVTHESSRKIAEKPLTRNAYTSVPSTPASYGAESASVEIDSDTGDADADRVIRSKRADASAMNFRHAQRNLEEVDKFKTIPKSPAEILSPETHEECKKLDHLSNRLPHHETEGQKP
jgi:hypothetical protein